MGRLLVQKLHPDAKLPTIAHPGEDLGYDVYALEDTFLEPLNPVIVKTGIAARYIGDRPYVDFRSVPIGDPNFTLPEAPKFGLEVRDRSGMAAKNGIETLAGIIDAGYTSEIGIVMVLIGGPQNLRKEEYEILIADLRKAGERFKATISSEQALQLATIVINNRVRDWADRHGAFPGSEGLGYQIKAGDKIAQLLPRQVHSGEVVEVDQLPQDGKRGAAGYGSTGR